MAQTVVKIPWNDGAGNIVLTLDPPTLRVESDTDNLLSHTRQQQVSVYVSRGALTDGILSQGRNRLKTASGSTVRALDNRMKVTLTVSQPTGLRCIVTASGHTLATSNHSQLRLMP